MFVVMLFPSKDTVTQALVLIKVWGQNDLVQEKFELTVFFSLQKPRSATEQPISKLFGSNFNKKVSS